jgi:hypothetical protein
LLRLGERARNEFLIEMIRIFLIACIAAITTQSCMAEEDRWPDTIVSPDKQLKLVFRYTERTYPEDFTIQDKNGNTLCSSRECTAIREDTGFQPDHVVWRPDSKAVAVCGGLGTDLETYVFVRSNKTFVGIPIPVLDEHYDNPYMIPLKWLSGNRLIIDISGPHAGHVGLYYRGRTTVRITDFPIGYEILYEDIKEK